MIRDVETDRLLLRVVPLEALQATIADDKALVEELLQLKVHDEWLAESWVAGLRFEQWQQNPEYGPWSIRAIALRGTGEMVGYINAHAAPQPGFMEGKAPNGIEIGYLIFSPWRGRGIAYEAITAFNAWARAHGVDSVVLSISPENEASLALAAKLGASKIGSHIDERDGPEDIFLLSL
jgi:RimJ/RimL family protein N-acetyltransferase